MPDTIAQRFALAFGGNDQHALLELYDEDVLARGPALARPGRHHHRAALQLAVKR